MAEGDDLATRVDAVEERLTRVEGDAAAARFLASRCDRDVAGMKQAVRSFRRSLRAVDRNVTDLRKHVDVGFRDLREELRSEMQDGFALMAVGIDAIHDRLDRLAGES